MSKKETVKFAVQIIISPRPAWGIRQEIPLVLLTRGILIYSSVISTSLFDVFPLPLPCYHALEI